MVYELWLPDHELLNFVELGGKKLDQDPAGKIKAFLVFKHLGETNPVHQSDQSVIVERFLAHLDYLNNQTFKAFSQGQIIDRQIMEPVSVPFEKAESDDSIEIEFQD